MKSPPKDQLVQMLEQRLRQYEVQYAALEHDIIAARATESSDAAEVVDKQAYQQEVIEKAYKAIETELERVQAR